MIITADDFGRDQACTNAIAESLANGLVSAASIMANGSFFEEASALVRTLGLTGRIGVHLSLDEGPALSREMLRFADSRGYLRVRRSLAPLGRALGSAVEAELTAQIERVLAVGIHPTHLDSHRHIHTAFPIGRLVVRLARRYGIPYVRPARNLAHRGSVAAGAYKWAFNRYLRFQVEAADYFGDIADLYESGNRPVRARVIECMIHLDRSARGIVGMRLLKDEAFGRFIENYELVGHAHAFH